MTGANLRPMPADFPDHATESMVALMKRYHAGHTPISRWKALCGTLRPWGRAVIRTDEDGNEQRFERIKWATEDIFAPSYSNIYDAIRNGRRAYGYRWRWAEE